jgi:type I restriction enzyme S subunit
VSKNSVQNQSEWTETTLGNLADFEMGQAPPGNECNKEGNGTIFVKAGEFRELYPEEVEWTIKPLKFGKIGDVFICVVGATAGKLNLGINCAIGRSVAAIRPRHGIDTKFIYYQLMPWVLRLRAASAGSAQGVISKAQLNQIPFKIIPLPQQKSIVAEIEKQFSRLDEAVANLKRVKANLKRYKAAVLKAAVEGKLTEEWRKAHPDVEPASELLKRILAERRAKWSGRTQYKEIVTPDSAKLSPPPKGWTWCMSDSLFSFVTSGSRGWAKYYSDSGAIFLRIGNLDHENIRLDLTEVQHVSPPIGAEGVRTMVQSNDILISITADVGMVTLVPDGLGEAYINQHVALVRLWPLVSSRYVAYYLSASQGGWGYFKKLQRGATKAGLGLDDVRSVPVPLPPLAEQEQIVAEVEQRFSVAEDLEGVALANVRRATCLRQAILQRAFSGSLATNGEGQS